MMKTMMMMYMIITMVMIMLLMMMVPTSLVQLYPRGSVHQVAVADDVDLPVSAVLLVGILNVMTLNQTIGPRWWLPVETYLTLRHHFRL